uniref:Secreted protein n=1 Tax=Octopus bimaculoides TaxID=37653 RepID=A0A0L8HDI2_OCTBM
MQQCNYFMLHVNLMLLFFFSSMQHVEVCKKHMQTYPNQNFNTIRILHTKSINHSYTEKCKHTFIHEKEHIKICTSFRHMYTSEHMHMCIHKIFGDNSKSYSHI